MNDLDRYLPLIAAGDANAFGRWVAGAEPRLRASLALLAAQIDTEAVLQETLLRIWQVAPRVVPDGAPNALLRLGVRVARNLALSELRKQRVRPDVILAIERDDPIEGHVLPHTPDPMLREIIARCRERLPTKPGAALSARLDGVARPDVALAADLTMKLNTFLQNVTRARKLLQDCLQSHGVDLAQEIA